MQWLLNFYGYDGTQSYGFEIAFAIHLALGLLDMLFITRVLEPVGDDIPDKQLDAMLAASKIRFFIGIFLGFWLSFPGVLCAWVCTFAFEVVFTTSLEDEEQEAPEDPEAK